MSEMTLSLPVSLEQIAFVLKQLGYEELRRLIEMVPSLGDVAREPLSSQSSYPLETELEQMQTELLALYENHPPSLDELFLDGMTTREYLALSETEQTKLLDQWEEID